VVSRGQSIGLMVLDVFERRCRQDDVRAIKALHARVGPSDAENASLRAQLAALRTAQARHDLRVDLQLQRLTIAVSASRERRTPL
jgi:hypothetical protein